MKENKQTQFSLLFTEKFCSFCSRKLACPHFLEKGYFAVWTQLDPRMKRPSHWEHWWRGNRELFLLVRLHEDRGPHDLSTTQRGLCLSEQCRSSIVLLEAPCGRTLKWVLPPPSQTVHPQARNPQTDHCLPLS